MEVKTGNLKVGETSWACTRLTDLWSPGLVLAAAEAAANCRERE
jgi:hypothetical protein